MPTDLESTDGPPFLTRLGRAFRNVLIFGVVVTATSGGLYALSSLNARSWSLEVSGGQLIVMRGRMLPWGTEPFQPSDPKFVEAYGPLELNGNTALAVVGQRYGDRDELDRALFSVIELLARPRVSSDLKADLDIGVALVRRAEALSGLSEPQRTTLKALKAEVAYFLARQRIDDARRQLDEAVSQLKLAADADVRHAREATQMLLTVEPQVRALSDSLRAAIQGLPAPPPPPARGMAGTRADAGSEASIEPPPGPTLDAQRDEGAQR